MVVSCPTCKRANPPEAYYCYFDGAALSKGQTGPLQIGSIPFGQKFFFADGHSCNNFNELALACNSHWEEAKGLLADNVWPNFFRSMGRLDLAEVARLASLEPDRDFGMAMLLEKLPADPGAVRLPKLAIEHPGFDLGRLAPRTDGTFDLTIFNQGMYILYGSVSTNCDWIAFGDNDLAASMPFRTPQTCSITVRLVSHNLRASTRLMTGEIVVDSNGGIQTIPVQALIPITPFPRINGNHSLAGATSPREIAERARKSPQEAGMLFAQSAVKDWYEANGWTYPVEHPTGSGKAAVQQYFEALGLTMAPVLEIDTDSIEASGAPGECLGRSIVLSTTESKPLYAHVATDQGWMRASPAKPGGNRLKIPIRIDVPGNPGETLKGFIAIQGNGRQNFRIPVTLKVSAVGSARGHVPTKVPPLSGKTMLADPVPAPYSPRPPAFGESAPGQPASGPQANPFGSRAALLALLLVAALGIVAAVWMMQPPSPPPPSTLLVQHRNVVFADTVFVMNFDLAALRGVPRLGKDKDCHALEGTLKTMLTDLRLETGDGIESIAVSHRANGDEVIVWSLLPKPANLDLAMPGRFKKLDGRFVVLQDIYDQERGWALDDQGRLLSGPLDSVKEALRADTPAAKFDRLTKAAQDVPPESPFWLVADLSNGPGQAPPSWLKDIADVTRANHFNLSANPAKGDALTLDGRFAIPNSTDAAMTPKRAWGFDFAKLPGFGAKVQMKEIVFVTTWKTPEKQALSTTKITPEFVTQLSEGFTKRFGETNQRMEGKKKEVVNRGIALANKTMDAGQHEDSVKLLQQLSLEFPTSREIGAQITSANSYVKNLNQLGKELDKNVGSFDPKEAQRLFDECSVARRKDVALVVLKEKLMIKKQEFEANREIREARIALDKGDYSSAEKKLGDAIAKRPDDKDLPPLLECSAAPG